MALKTIEVDLEGLGPVIIKELAFKDYEPLMNQPEVNTGMAIIKLCLYKADGSRYFDDPELSLDEAKLLFTLSDRVQEVNNLGKKQKAR